jgi:hypothetical protein
MSTTLPLRATKQNLVILFVIVSIVSCAFSSPLTPCVGAFGCAGAAAITAPVTGV